MTGSIRTSLSTKFLYDIEHVLLKGHRHCQCMTVQDELLEMVVKLQSKIRHAEEIHYRNQTRNKANDRKTPERHC